MYIVLEKNADNIEQVINIIQTSDEAFVEKWIDEYISTNINSLKMKPLQNSIKSVNYTIKHHNNTFIVSETVQQVSAGYIYNTITETTQEISNIKYLSYTGENTIFNTDKNTLYLKLNNEINNRVLRQLDKDSLYQIFVNLQQRITLTNTWNNDNFTQMLSEVIGNFKKELYSNVVKKLHRFGTLQKQLLPPIRSNNGGCSLEAKKIQ